MTISHLEKSNKTLQEQFKTITSIALDLLTSQTYASLVHIRGTAQPMWQLKMQYILLFQRFHKEQLDNHCLHCNDLNAFIDALHHAYEVLESPDLNRSNKALLQWLFRTQIRSIFLNRNIKNALFNRRSELHKDNPFRTFFLADYINNEVYALLYNEEDVPFKHVGSQQLMPNNFSELENAQFEYERCFDVLCRAYGEDDLKTKMKQNVYAPEDLPPKLREALKNYYDVIWKELDRMKDKKQKKKGAFYKWEEKKNGLSPKNKKQLNIKNIIPSEV